MEAAADRKRCRDCGNKVTYKNKTEANRVLARIEQEPRYRPRKKYKSKSRQLEIYKCPWSDGYHIGHHVPK